MLVEGWKEKFSPAALGRGLALYLDGKVGEPKLGDGGWSCGVEGEAAFADASLEHASCTCENGPFCEHVAAACYEVEHEFGQAALAGFFPSDAPGGTRATQATAGEAPSPAPDEVLASLTDKQCRDFLANVIKEDDHWANALVRRFAPLPQDAMEHDFMRGVKQIVDENSYEGFVNWRDSLRCARDLDNYAQSYLQPLIDRGDYASVVELVNAFALNLQSIAVDDSEGFFNEMVGLCLHYWQLTFDSAPELRPKLFAWMKSLVLGDAGSDEDDAGALRLIEDNVEEFIVQHFALDADFAADVEQLADAVLASEQAKADEARAESPDGRAAFPARPSARYLRWARARLSCMRLAGEDRQAIESYALTLQPSLDILQPLVDAAVDAGETGSAIGLLRRAETLGKTTDSALQLTRLLDGQGRADEARDEWFWLCLKGRQNGRQQLFKWFSQLKRHAGDEWSAWEKKLENALGDDKSRLREFWEWEGRTDDIVRSLQGANRWECEPYRALLLERSPETYLDAAVHEARSQLFGPEASRSEYRRGINTLAQLRKIPGGEAAIARIVDELRTTYPNRTALMEELDAVFGKREIEGGGDEGSRAK